MTCYMCVHLLFADIHARCVLVLVMARIAFYNMLCIIYGHGNARHVSKKRM